MLHVVEDVAHVGGVDGGRGVPVHETVRVAHARHEERAHEALHEVRVERVAAERREVVRERQYAQAGRTRPPRLRLLRVRARVLVCLRPRGCVRVRFSELSDRGSRCARGLARELELLAQHVALVEEQDERGVLEEAIVHHRVEHVGRLVQAVRRLVLEQRLVVLGRGHHKQQCHQAVLRTTQAHKTRHEMRLSAEH